MENFEELLGAKILECDSEVAMIMEAWCESLCKMKEHLYDKDLTEYYKWLKLALYYEKECIAYLENKRKCITTVKGLSLTA